MHLSVRLILCLCRSVCFPLLAFLFFCTNSALPWLSVSLSIFCFHLFFLLSLPPLTSLFFFNLNSLFSHFSSAHNSLSSSFHLLIAPFLRLFLVFGIVFFLFPLPLNSPFLLFCSLYSPSPLLPDRPPLSPPTPLLLLPPLSSCPLTPGCVPN